MKRVLVTGANGFVGRHLCSELLDNGWMVRAAVRTDKAVVDLPPGVEPHVLDAGGWVSALSGVRSVVHLIARTHVLRDQQLDPLTAYRLVNVETTRELLEASLKVGVKRFVYLSSIKAVGEGRGPLPYTEDSSCSPEDAYGISKLEAEGLVLEAAALGIEPVVVRPPLVYGPGVRGNFLRLLQAISKGIPLPLGMVHNERSMVFVGNLVNALRCGLEAPNAVGEVFHVADREPVSTSNLIVRLGKHLGRSYPVWPMPVPLLRLAGTLLHRENEIERLVGSLTVSATRAKQLMGWVPPYSMDDGLRRTVEWFSSSTKA